MIMAERIRVCVIGCCGRMGQEVVRTVQVRENLQLVAGVDVVKEGADVGEVAGIMPVGIAVCSDLERALKESGTQVAVDFTRIDAAVQNVRTCIVNGVSPVVGTTGWNEQQLGEVGRLCEERNVPAFICPNFAIGAVLMMKFAAQAAKYMDRVEIMELHHDGKVDAPSGTAMRTAELILQARGGDYPPAKVKEPDLKLPGVLGGERGGVRIHSVRLPGLVAHQEVIFGGTAQVLTIRHDSLGRESFMPGVVMAIERVRSLKGLVVGLENLLD